MRFLATQFEVKDLSNFDRCVSPTIVTITLRVTADARESFSNSTLNRMRFKKNLEF